MDSAFIVGCGYTGAVLARRLTERGWQVAGLARTAQQIPGVSVQMVDLLDPRGLDLSPARGALVYYMVPPLFRHYLPQEHPHLAPLERLLEGLRLQGIRGLVYLSSTSVYGDRGGDWVDEETPPNPDSPWGLMRVELEERVAAFGRRHSVPTVRLRLPEIYGPGRGPLQRLRAGYRLRHPDRWTNRIHLDDLVEVLLELGRRPAPELLLCSDSEPARAAEVYQLAAGLLGKELLLAEGDARDAGGDANRLALARDSKRCRNTRLLAWLSRPLRYPSFREGLPATL